MTNDDGPAMIDSVSALVGAMAANRNAWFRGQPKFGWPLTPRLLRRSIERQPSPLDGAHDVSWERQLNSEFRRRSASMVDVGRPNSDIYVLAQHHGLPTRLLDWTTGALTALFFAVSDRDDQDAGLFTLNPNYRYQVERQINIQSPLPIREPTIASVFDRLFDIGNAGVASAPIPLLPNLERGRMLQQSTCFTLHLPGADTLPQDQFTEYLIPSEAKRTIRDQLRFAGVTWSALFPELEYVARDICVEFGLT